MRGICPFPRMECKFFPKIRVGYIISNSRIAKLLFNLKPMYEINSIGTIAAITALKNSKIRNNYISDTKKGERLLIKYLDHSNIDYIKTSSLCYI